MPAGNFRVISPFDRPFGFACGGAASHFFRAMKIRHFLLPVFAAALLVGCGQKETATAPATQAAAPAAPAAPAATTAPAAKSAPAAAAAAPAAARVVEITANDQMKFNLATIEAKAGEKLQVVLANIGQLPKEVMGHNWVLLKAGTDALAFATASAVARDNDYIAPALKEQVIVATPIIGPRKNAEVEFTVPAAGEYVYLCTFPAHFAIGMKGMLVVK